MLLVDLIEGVGQKTQKTKGRWVLGKSTPLAPQNPILAPVLQAGFCKCREELPERRVERFRILWVQSSLEERTNDVSAECTETQ